MLTTPQRNVEDAFRDIATSTSGNIGRLANSSESFHFRSGLLYKASNFGIVNGLGKIQVWTYEKKFQAIKQLCDLLTAGDPSVSTVNPVEFWVDPAENCHLAPLGA